MEWKCATCGKVHTGLPEGFAYDAPVGHDENYPRTYVDEDYCVLNDEDFFVRGCLEIPIVGHDELFIWGVWVSLSRENFERTRKLEENPKRTEEPPYFGWLSTRIPIYPDTLFLKTNVHTRGVGMRPSIELEPTDHPLAVEQRAGITEERVREIAELVEHAWEHPELNRDTS